MCADHGLTREVTVGRELGPAVGLHGQLVGEGEGFGVSR